MMIKRAGETKRIEMYDGSDMSDSWQLNNSCAMSLSVNISVSKEERGFLQFLSKHRTYLFFQFWKEILPVSEEGATRKMIN